MANIDLTQIGAALISLLAALVTGYVLPYLKAKLDSEKFDSMRRHVSVGVKAAETLGPAKGREKLAFVEKYLTEHGIAFDLAAVEAAVLENFGKSPELRSAFERPQNEINPDSVEHEV